MKDVADYEGLYAVTRDGRVWSYSKRSPRGNGLRHHGKWLRHNPNSRGYERVWLSKKGRGRRIFVHRMVATAHLPKQRGKNHVNHLNGNPKDNRVENLEWCTKSENHRHAYRTGLHKPVVHNPERFSKLTRKEVREVRRLHLNGKDAKSISQKYGVTRASIYNIVSGKTWALKNPEEIKKPT